MVGSFSFRSPSFPLRSSCSGRTGSDRTINERAPRAAASAAPDIIAVILRHRGAEGSIMKVYVGNLSPESTEQQLRDLAAPFGRIDSVALVMDKATGKAKGFGFVEFGTDSEGAAAISGLNGKEVGGKALTVNEARSKTAPVPVVAN
jgi:RNA recognition motif-containing protein